MEMSPGTSLLATLFFSKPKKWYYDIPSYIFHKWLTEKESADISSTDCLYWEFIWWEIILDKIIADYEFAEVEDEKELLEEFRKNIFLEVLNDLDPLRKDDGEDFLKPDDLSDFVQIMCQNRIRWDKDVKSQMRVLYTYMSWWSIEWFDIGNMMQEYQKRTNIEDLTTEELEELERETWKKNILEAYIPYVEEMDLTSLKGLLRDPLWNSFYPQWWQRDLLVNMKRFNFVAASRRCWKTYVGTYLAARQLYIPNQTIIYVVPVLKRHAKTPWKYLKSFLSKDPDISFNKSEGTITHEKLWSEIQFMAGDGDGAVRSMSANLLIFDEAAYLKEEIYESAAALVRTTKGIVYCISTVNIKVPKNRFYYKLVDAEIARYDEWSSKYWRRVSLHENPFIPEEEKKEIIQDGKRNLTLFWAEWMAEFQESDDFDLTRFWIIDYNPLKYVIAGLREANFREEALDKNLWYYNNFIIAHDGAKRKDMPGLSILWRRKWGADIILADYLKWFEYVDQVKIILWLRELLWKDRCHIVLDYRNAWVVVEEIFRREHKVWTIPIQAVWWVILNRDWRIYNVWKDLLRGKFKWWVSRWVIRWFSFMNFLRIEAETYSDEADQSRKADSHHYDILNSLFIWSRYADKIWWLEVVEESAEELAKQRVVEGMLWTNDLSYIFNKEESNERIDKFGY